MTQLCMTLGDWRGDMPDGGAMVETKIDGFRCLRFQGIAGATRLWTRNGMPIDGCDHIAARLDAMEAAAGVPIMVDGELQVDGTLAATKVWVEGGWKRGGTAGLFHAFDVMPLSEWKRGGWNAPLHERKAWLRDLFSASEPSADDWTWAPGSKGAPIPAAVRLVDDEWAVDAAGVVDAVRRVWAAGGEGVVVKDALAPYRRTRSDAAMKVKGENMHKWARRPFAV